MAGKVKCLIGNKYGRLTVVSRAENKSNQTAWNCICDCGNKKAVARTHLKSGATKSCGCLNSELVSKRAKKHGLLGTPTYNSWSTMKQRCSDVNNPTYKNYGGRGITICKRWEKFENFYKDMSERPEGKTLDRIDNNKGYSKENCRWANVFQQNANRRKSSLNTSGMTGVTKTNTGSWLARITVKKKCHRLGTFKKFQEACNARIEGEIKFRSDNY